jgi:hypothetical protein
MFNPFKKSKPEIQAPPLPVVSATQNAPDYLQPIVEVVEENWELPASDQFDHAFNLFVEELLRPIEMMEDDFADRQLVLQGHVQRMVEIAPDLFDKAMRRTPFESGYFIESEIQDA